MKKRILSILLAAGVLFGGRSGGYGVTAAVSQPDEQAQTAAEDVKKGRQNAPDAADAPEQTTEETETETTAAALTEETSEETTTETAAEAEHRSAVLTLKSTFPSAEIFTGQQERYWSTGTGFVLQDYYSVKIDGKYDSSAKDAFRVKAVPAADGQSYTFAAESDSVSYDGAVCDVSFSDSRTVRLREYDPRWNNDHKPDKYQDVQTVNKKGVICLKADSRFRIAADSKPASFSFQSVPVSSLKDNTYYLRNVDQNDKAHYLAVSKAYTADIDTQAQLSAYAVIAEDLDLSTQTAYSGDLTVTVTGFAMADSATLQLWQDGKLLCSEAADPVEKDGESEDKNTFKMQYTFELSKLPEKSKVIRIENLQAKLLIGKNEISQNLQLSDAKKNTRSSLILDGDAPVVVYQGEGEWKGWNYAQFTVRDFYKDPKVEGCGIKSISYSFDGDNWIDAATLPWNTWRNFQQGMTEFTFAVDASVTKQNGEVRVVFRGEDMAGNVKTITQDEDTGKWFVMNADSKVPVIDSIEVYGRAKSGTDRWIPLDPGTVFPFAYGTFMKEPLQLRIRAHDPQPDDGGEASGIESVTAGGQNCTPHYKFLSSDDDSVLTQVADDELSARLTDYYVFETEAGSFYDDFCVTVKDKGQNKAVMTLKDILNDHLGIDVILSDDLYCDAEAPELKAEAEQYVTRIVTDASGEEPVYRYWYGMDALDSADRKIKVSFSDANGIADVRTELDGTENKAYSQDFSGKTEMTKNGEISIPVSAFREDGNHTVIVTVTDNACNITQQTVYLRLDYRAPEVTKFSTVENLPDGWCRSDVLPVFQLAFTDENPEKAVLTVNGQTKTFTAESWTEEADGSISVTLDLASDTDDNKMPFKFDSEQMFRISGIVYDVTGNESDTWEKTVCADTEDPSVNSVQVSQTETAAEKLLRVLTFGIFSNEKYQYTVHVTDGEHDSGIELAEIQLEPDGEFYPMTRFAASDFYTYVIPKGDPDYRLVDDERYEGVVVIRATDRVGRVTTVFGEDSDGDGVIQLGTDGNVRTGSNYFMLENIAPQITVDMPEADSGSRTAERWYTLTDADKKFIKVTASDPDSGLYEVKATLTAQGKEGFRTVQRSRDYVILSGDSVEHLDEETYKLTDLRTCEQAFDLLTLFRDLTPDLDGRCEFTVTAVDLAGNTFTSEPAVYYMDWKTPEIRSIDLTPVSADRYGSTGDYPGGAQFVDVLEYGFYFKEPFTATVNVSDEGPSSGMDRVSCRLVEYQNNSLVKEGAVQYASVGADGKASFRIPADFKGQIYVSPFDNVGNTPEKEVTPHSFVVDTPQRHAADDHISVTGFAQTAFRDAEQHPLYTGDVTLTVRITDAVSGIRSIAYAMNSERNAQEERTIEIPNTGCRTGQTLSDGWSIAKMDENLVTEVVRVFSFTGDDNGIGLRFRMTDRSGNTSEKNSDVFSIDQTAPVIHAEFHPASGNGAYYSQKRTATVTVTERNFDASRIRAEISNRIGGTPSMSFRDESDTVHIAELEFDEGDYSFSLSGTDLCDHAANVNYSGGNENEFYVDLHDPVVVSNFSELTNGAGNSFRSDQKVTLSITEHNFVRDSVRITVERAPSGKELNSANRVDCTNEFVTRDMWTGSGDVHTAGFTFSKDAVYRVTVSVTDAAGRSAATVVSPIFEVDKKKPVLDGPANLSKLVYTKKSPQTEADPITFADENIERVVYTVVSYRLKRDADQIGYDMEVSEPKEFEVRSNSVVLGEEYFGQDGIYEVKCVAYDAAGNQSDATTHTYVVQRDSDFLVYIPESSKENKTGLYKFNQVGIRSADFEDIRVIAYVTSDRSFGIQVDGEDVTGDDSISIRQLSGSELGGGKKDGETINQVTAYDLTLRNSYIAQKYGDETIDTDLLLNAVAASETDVQKITLGHIYIDNVKPVGEYEASLQNLGFFGGFYGMDSRAVKIEGVSPDINLERSEIQLNDTVLKAEDGGFVYDEDAHTIGFTLGKGYTDIKTTLVDNAGNTYNLPVVKKVYVGGLFARFWYLFILGGLALIAVPALVIGSFLRKKRSGAAY